MWNIFDLVKREFLDYDWVEEYYEKLNQNRKNFNGFMQCDLGDNITPLVNRTSSFAVTEDNKYLAEITFPSFVTADMIDIDVIDEKRTLYISSHFKDDNGIETSSATVERLPDDADINSLAATFDKGRLTLTMDKSVKETLPKTLNIHHK